MADDSWYRSAGWSDTDRAAFERKLARAKRKAEYLSTKAGFLLQSDRPDWIAAGRGLLVRIISDESRDLRACAFAHQALAQSFLNDDVVKAEHHYRECIALRKRTKKHSDGEGRPELQLATVLLRKGDAKSLKEAARILSALEGEIKRGSIFIEADMFEHAIASARVFRELRMAAKAQRYATRALVILDTPHAPLHPSLKPTASPGLYDELKKLAGSRPT